MMLVLEWPVLLGHQADFRVAAELVAVVFQACDQFVDGHGRSPLVVWRLLFGAFEESDHRGQAVVDFVDAADVRPVDRVFVVAGGRHVEEQLADPFDQVLGHQVARSRRRLRRSASASCSGGRSSSCSVVVGVRIRVRTVTQSHAGGKTSALRATIQPEFDRFLSWPVWAAGAWHVGFRERPTAVANAARRRDRRGRIASRGQCPEGGSPMSGPLDPTRLTVEQAAKLLSAAAKIHIPAEHIAADVDAGAHPESGRHD